MLEQEILKTRKSIRRDEERYAFDALLSPLEGLRLAEKKERLWVAEARRLAGKMNWASYSTIRQSFLEHAGDLLKRFESPGFDKVEYREKMYVRFMEGRIRYFLDLGKREKCELPAIEVGTADFHNAEMAAVFAHLREDPDTVKFLDGLGVHWTYEQLHMVTWFASQVTMGKGFYSRSRPNYSARVTYGRLLNPESLIWIAAALGEDQDLIRQAVSAAESRKLFKEKVVIIRNFIPFTRIYRLALPLVEEERNRLAENAG